MADNIPAIDYTSRDFPSLRASLIKAVQDRIPGWAAANPSDFGLALVEAFAYLGDSAQYYIDRIGNEAFLPTATQRQSLLDISQMLGYSPSNPLSARAPSMTVFNPTASDIVMSPGTLFTVNVPAPTGIRTLYFEAVLPTSGTVAVPAATPTGPGHVDISAIEGRTVSYEDLGLSTGSPDQEFRVLTSPLAEGSLEVVVGVADSTSVVTADPVYGTIRYGELIWSAGPDTYLRMIGYSDSGPNSKIYYQRTEIDGSTTLRFGDGVNGLIPARDRKVYATYRVGGGSIGNLPSGTELVGPGSLYAVFNTASSGGVDAESDDSIRRNAASTFRSRNRAVTLQDFADLALSVPGVLKTVARADAYSSIALTIAPMAAAGDAAPGFDNYLITSHSSSGTTHTVTVPGYPSYPDPVGTKIRIYGVGFGWDSPVAAADYLITAYAPGTSSAVITFTSAQNQTLVDTSCTGVIVRGETSANVDLRTRVKSLLEERATVGCTATVSPVSYLHVEVAVTLYVEPDVRWTVARAAAKGVLLSLFDYEIRSPGSPVRYQDIVIGIARLTEVGWAEVTKLKPMDRTSPAEVNEIYPAPGEMLRLLEGNITISFGGGVGINDLPA